MDKFCHCKPRALFLFLPKFILPNFSSTFEIISKMSEYYPFEFRCCFEKEQITFVIFKNLLIREKARERENKNKSVNCNHSYSSTRIHKKEHHNTTMVFWKQFNQWPPAKKLNENEHFRTSI